MSDKKYEENRKLEFAVRTLQKTCIKHYEEDCINDCPLYEVCSCEFPSAPKFWDLEEFLRGSDNLKVNKRRKEME